MRRSPRSDDLTLALLGFAIAVPVLYYGIQVVAAPFYPDFSVVRTIASELGTDRSTHPWVFNGGVFLTGIAAIVGSIGLRRALRRLGAHSIVAWLSLLVVVGTGLSAFWAAMYPLPDPRHGGHPAFLIAMIALPFVLSFALWRLGVSRAIKAYLIATIVLFLGMLPIVSGMIPVNVQGYEGLIQRIFAQNAFVPIGVTGFVLARRIVAAKSKDGEPDEAATAAPLAEESH